MAYFRFLTDNDYHCIATEEHMKQLIRDLPDRIPQAEQRAEMHFLEYLDQYYEIEKVLAVGKNIRDYNPAVSYPGNTWIKVNGDVFKTLVSINGYKAPTKEKYWAQVVEFVDPCLIEHAKKYSQLRMYSKGEIVKFGTEFWRCLVPHGYDAGEIHVPGVNAWKEVEAVEWEPLLEWAKNDVCSYGGEFYQFLAEDSQDQDPDATPDNDDNWGLIGEYSKELEYEFSEDSHDYVVADGAVFIPMMNPNADALQEGVNITRDDPRNQNIVAHMSRIALYYLHQIISPTNISETRRWAYEDSMRWLHDASKFKINPQLPRKRECESGEKKVDWALATFQKGYDPHENAWLI